MYSYKKTKKKHNYHLEVAYSDKPLIFSMDRYSPTQFKTNLWLIFLLTGQVQPITIKGAFLEATNNSMLFDLEEDKTYFFS